MAAVRGDMGVQSAAGGWDALPGDIWQLILDRLVSVDTLYSVACAARDLACLSQVCRSLRGVPAPAWAWLAEASPALPDCPLTCLPFVYGLSSSSSAERGIYCVSRHGRPLDWAAVGSELHRAHSQVTFGPGAVEACLTALGVKQFIAWGGGEAERASALRARLPRPLPAGASSVVPAGVALEVRRLRSCVLSSPEARRLYALTEADLKALPGAAEAGAKRSRRATHQLLDVLRVARAKHGTAQGMEARSRAPYYSGPHGVMPPHSVIPPGAAQREAQAELKRALQARGLRAEDCGIACMRALHADARASYCQLSAAQALAAAERRAFLAGHCSAEHALMLSGCAWAARQGGRTALFDEPLLAMEERAEQAALQDFVAGAGSLAAALAHPELPQGMRDEISRCHEELQQVLAALQL